MKKDSTNDMTAGPVAIQLAVFSIPILLGELFQQFYNSVDSAIVGSCVSPQALAAVGATGSITKMLVGFFMGISLGCTVVIARHFGAKEYGKLQEAIHCIMNLSIALGAALSALGVALTPLMLRLLGTPEDVLPLAATYLRIYFGGLGHDSFPANGCLALPAHAADYKGMLSLGNPGPAVFGRYHTGGLSDRPSHRPAESDYPVLQRDRDFLCGPFRILLQAGWAVYAKVNGFPGTTSSSVASSATTFVSQNLGAGKRERIWKGIQYSLLISYGMITVLNLLILHFSDGIIGLFGADLGMVSYARLFIHTFLWFYLLQATHQVLAGGLRGLGCAVQSTAAVLIALVGVRQAFLWIAFRFWESPVLVGAAYPVAWVCSILLLGFCYRLYGASKQLQ